MTLQNKIFSYNGIEEHKIDRIYTEYILTFEWEVIK